MLGGIIGDIVGSKYEFNNISTKDFDIFDTKGMEFTDDTVMMVAVADVLLHHKKASVEEISKVYQKWCRKYPGRGYGGRFYKWIYEEKPKPYGSWGNGATMRIAPVAWIAKNEKEVKELSKKVTEVSHNSKEGLLGAEVLAMCIYYLRHNKDKQFIKDYASRYYNLDLDYEELRTADYVFDESVMTTLPQAIYCFLISNSFEDCLRTAISIGGDSDTIADMACSLAEAYYGLPKELLEHLLPIIPDEMGEIITEVYKQNAKYVSKFNKDFAVNEMNENLIILINCVGPENAALLVGQLAMTMNHACVTKGLEDVRKVTMSVNDLFTSVFDTVNNRVDIN